MGRRGPQFESARPDHYSFDEVNFLQMADQQTRVAGFRSGAVHLTGVEKDEEAAFPADKRFVSEKYFATGTNGIMMNYKDQRFKDIRLRKASASSGTQTTSCRSMATRGVCGAVSCRLKTPAGI